MKTIPGAAFFTLGLSGTTALASGWPHWNPLTTKPCIAAALLACLAAAKPECCEKFVKNLWNYYYFGGFGLDTEIECETEITMLATCIIGFNPGMTEFRDAMRILCCLPF
jgi:hypothetical protein